MSAWAVRTIPDRAHANRSIVIASRSLPGSTKPFDLLIRRDNLTDEEVASFSPEASWAAGLVSNARTVKALS